MAYHFHWPPETIVNLEHRDRLRWVKEISAINERMNSDRGNETNAETNLS